MKIVPRYNVGRNNLAITIFVPYDCPNHCPFCTSKEDYKDTGNFSLNNIIMSLSKVGNLEPIKDIVITGGEPFADLSKLQILLDECIKYEKNIYINTTLPVKSKLEKQSIISFLYNNKDKINGLNISRHMKLKTNYEDDELIKLIHIMIPSLSLRINSVLLGLTNEINLVKEFIDKYKTIVNSINFRGDYTKIKDQNDLRTLDHPILDVLFNDIDLQYISSGGCLVCNDNGFFDRQTGCHISLHRGYEHSLVKKGDYYILNDIIIKQDGRVLCDWDGELLDVNSLSLQWGYAKLEEYEEIESYEYPDESYSCGCGKHTCGGYCGG